ncbi:MAG: hypothetical protein KAG97_06840 [Victivallales bacterium]|nr:hypothetical protein [Victivallales bacterium]
MPEEVDVACPSCDAVFSVPLEFCGETAQCAECDAIFEIPTPDEADSDGNMTQTDTGPIQGAEADAGEATNTVRLSRTGIGMIPQVKDSFAFGGASPAPAPAIPKPSFAKPAASQRPSIPSAPAPSAPPATPTSTAKDFAPPAPPAAPEKKKERIVIPSWTKIRMKKDEEVLGLKEYTASPAALAATAAAIAAVCGGAGIGIGLAGSLPVAAVAVVVLAAVAFAAIFFMAKGGNKAALVVTSLRSICVIGSKRLEITK